jgi:hypothetical protein
MRRSSTALKTSLNGHANQPPSSSRTSRSFNRIAAAYAARKFPVILDLLAEGSINLTTIRVLAPHLTAGNHRDVLAEATGKAKAEVLEIKARLEPRPDVRSSIRKLPAPRTLVAASTVQPSVPPSSVPPPPLVPQPSRAVVEPLGRNAIEWNSRWAPRRGTSSGAPRTSCDASSPTATLGRSSTTGWT